MRCRARRRSGTRWTKSKYSPARLLISGRRLYAFDVAAPRVATGALIYRNEPHTAIGALIDGCGLYLATRNLRKQIVDVFDGVI